MPELPDLEVYRENVQPLVCGKTVAALVVIVRAVLRRESQEVVAALPGTQVADLTRRGKFLIFTFTGGARVLLHLMNSGELTYTAGAGERCRDTVAEFRFADGGVLALRCPPLRPPWPRLHAVQPGAEPAVLAGLGPDPLAPDFTASLLRQQLQKRPGLGLKAFLLDQSCLAGLGNAFADEVLWAARLHPRRKAGTLSPEETQHLYEAICQVLGQAITTIRQRLAGAIAGEVRDFLAVHRTATGRCPRCGQTITQETIAGHETFFCPACQPADA